MDPKEFVKDIDEMLKNGDVAGLLVYLFQNVTLDDYGNRFI